MRVTGIFTILAVPNADAAKALYTDILELADVSSTSAEWGAGPLPTPASASSS